jgi:hypothetical protein
VVVQERVGRFLIEQEGKRVTVTDVAEGTSIRAKLTEWRELADVLSKMSNPKERRP